MEHRPRNKPLCIYMIKWLKRMPSLHNEETNGAEKTGNPYTKKWTLILYTNINSKWIKDLNIRPTIIKNLKEKAEKLHNIRFGYDFLDMITKAQATKEKNRQIGLHQI